MKTLLLFVLTSPLVSAAVEEKSIDYQEGDTELEGFYAHDPEAKQTRKAVLIVHQWTGLSENEKMQARMLAKLGYHALALDIYGKGIRPQPPAAGKFAGKYKNDRKLYRQRLAAGLAQLKSLAKVSDNEVAAIGYCFGGTGVLEIARSGMPLAGRVSFQGSFGAADGLAANRESLKTKLLVLHGADLRFVAYPGAVHAFTQKGARNENLRGAA